MTRSLRPAIFLRRFLWALAVMMAVATAAELLLQVRSRRIEAARPRSVAPPLERAYAPFSVQHLHPHYFFFFPTDLAERQAINNAVCSIDAHGFREPGLDAAEGRRLAVLLGGSTVFGYRLSSNAATLSSRLNALQSEWFFLNAGVPGWTSTQELIRMTVQIADLRPALIIAMDGFNDAIVSGMRSPRTGLLYPAGTLEHFYDLERYVNDIRAKRTPAVDMFPELVHRYRKYRYGVEPESEPAPPSPERVSEAARAYLANQLKMSALAGSFGARFIAAFQPVGTVEKNNPADTTVTRFHDAVIQHIPPTLEFYDLFSALDASAGDETSLFSDIVHLSDHGSARLARILLAIVREG